MPDARTYFPGDTGESHYKGVCSIWDGIKNDVSDERITLHTLRHSFASVAGDLGYPESTIAGLIGHAKGSVTGRYVHPLDEVLIKAVNKVSATIAKYMSNPCPPISQKTFRPVKDPKRHIKAPQSGLRKSTGGANRDPAAHGGSKYQTAARAVRKRPASAGNPSTSIRSRAHTSRNS